MSLPAPAPNQAYCDISALESGLVQLPTIEFIEDGKPGEVLIGPSLSFLLRNNKNNKTFVFDLGIRKDWENYPPAVVQWCHDFFGVEIPQDVSESLIKGGLKPSDCDFVCLSHLHFDHVGDTRPFTKATFLVGASGKDLLSPGYPADSTSYFASDLLPTDRTNFLDTYGPDWKPLGPFPRALDFFGDGSLYITDAAGHLPGHINVVARTSADGGWILLGGDSAHNWRLVTGESKMSMCSHAFAGGCAHLDRKSSEENLARMRAFMGLPRTRIILAHDIPWYEKNKDGDAFWPGKIPSM
ncbi:hypothetical protein VNI00_002545 [Paramarasmius palmivorus]|uniref:Metallo-beta-lactamase domain-containing protein n=1 Tax=Paramarasmius palmivorus TaxID=297713 RepID=A0AAW0DZB6_9AGAR